MTECILCIRTLCLFSCPIPVLCVLAAHVLRWSIHPLDSGRLFLTPSDSIYHFHLLYFASAYQSIISLQKKT